MIKVIAFDFTGVISAFGPIKKWVDNNLSKTDKRYLTYINNRNKWDTGKMNLDEMYKLFSEITDVSPNAIWVTFFEKQILNESIVELIKKLKKNHKVFIFSNHHGGLLRKLLIKYRVTNLFDEIIISSEHKLKKPDPKFFDILLRKSNVNKNEILFIDDKLENIKGAKDFGINAFQFINSEKLLKDLKDFKIL